MGPRATPRELAGLRRASAELRTIARRYPDRIPGALYRRAEAIMTRSKNEFVPVEFGVLRDSGHVNPPTRERTDGAPDALRLSSRRPCVNSAQMVSTPPS